jgi:hypothetical protein
MSRNFEKCIGMAIVLLLTMPSLGFSTESRAAHEPSGACNHPQSQETIAIDKIKMFLHLLTLSGAAC